MSERFIQDVKRTGGVLMQNGRNPNRSQKRLLADNGKDSKEWLYIKTDGNALVFRNKTTNEIIKLS